MSNGFLSQEEIDALLRGHPINKTPEVVLTDLEKDALGEIGNMTMGTAATTLSTLLGRSVQITTPHVSLTSLEALDKDYPIPFVAIEVEFQSGLNGSNLLVMREEDARVIADLMIGTPSTTDTVSLTDLQLSAVGEAMNQMMGSAATSMSTLFKKRIDISPPNVQIINFADGKLATFLSSPSELVKISFRMVVEDLIDSEIMQIIPIASAKEMAGNLLQGFDTPAPAPVQPDTALQKRSSESTAQKPVSPPTKVSPQNDLSEVTNFNVQPAQFLPLQSGKPPQEESPIDLILDVPLQLTVELGRTKKLIREVLEFGPGSIIELDKLAGEPVDILVNGKLIAKGEVVVIDENFGVRVTEIISAKERIKNLQ